MSEFSAGPPKLTAPLTADDLAALNDEIAAMARAGLPLDQGLAVLAKEMGRGRLRDVTDALANDLHAGKPLPDALAAQGSRLPPFYSGLVAAGVRSGRLSDVLATLTAYARSMSELRATAINSLIYPAVILVVGFVMVLAWLVFVAPMFIELQDSAQKLFQRPGQGPAPAVVFPFVVKHPYQCVALPIGFLVVAFFAVRFAAIRTEAGRGKWTRFVYSIPLLGTLIQSARLASFTELLAILTEHRVPLPEAFRLASQASSDPLLRAGAKNVDVKLERGESLAAALRDEWLVPDYVVWAAGAGERSHRLAEMLRHTAAVYRRRAEMRASLFRSVFPAVTIVVVAIVLLLFVYSAVMAPMIGSIQSLAGGGM